MEQMWNKYGTNMEVIFAEYHIFKQIWTNMDKHGQIWK